jgi:hypothetical protein
MDAGASVANSAGEDSYFFRLANRNKFAGPDRSTYDGKPPPSPQLL